MTGGGFGVIPILGAALVIMIGAFTALVIMISKNDLRSKKLRKQLISHKCLHRIPTPDDPLVGSEEEWEPRSSDDTGDYKINRRCPNVVLEPDGQAYELVADHLKGTGKKEPISFPHYPKDTTLLSWWQELYDWPKECK